MGVRSEHIALPDLYDFVRGVAGTEASVTNHVEECRECQKDVHWLQAVATYGATEKKYDPPEWAVSNAQKVFSLKRPGIVTIAKEIVASLVFDSFNEPMAVGVRRRDLPARQALYHAGNVQLDLKIELGDEKGLIIGQLIADKADMDIRGLEVEITQKGEVIGKSRTNALGEFIFQDLPKGNYELQVLVADTMVKLPPLSQS